MEVEFIVPGKPRGKQRPKFARRGEFTTTYTPTPTREYEEKVRVEYNKAQRGSYFEGPLEIDIRGVFPIPKAVSKKKREQMIGTAHDKKPDADNMAKIILDPLNKLAYHDDGQVSKLNVEKVYGLDPRVEVSIKNVTNVSTESYCPLYLLTHYPEPAIYYIA